MKKLLSHSILTLTFGLCVLHPMAALAEEKTGPKVLSEWHLADYANDAVPNRVPNCGELILAEDSRSTPPVVEESGGVKGLRLRDGQSLTGNWRDMALDDQKPYSVKATVVPEDIPPGSFGGIFEACSYEKSGFRIVVKQDLQVVAEVFLGDGEENHKGLNSKSALTRGEPATIEVRFDGSLATLLINGIEEDVQDMGFPASYEGPIVIGKGAGDRYFFNGIVSEIKISGE